MSDDLKPLYVPTDEESAEMRRQALEALRPHTLPSDAPGAWIRDAIDSEPDTLSIAWERMNARSR